MKIALCHLELSCGPQERNLQLLEQAVQLAAEQGADWVLIPEMAVQGYYFYRIAFRAIGRLILEAIPTREATAAA